MMQQCIKMKPAEWSRYIAIYLGLPSECQYMACRITSDIFTKVPALLPSESSFWIVQYQCNVVSTLCLFIFFVFLIFLLFYFCPIPFFWYHWSYLLFVFLSFWLLLIFLNFFLFTFRHFNYSSFQLFFLLQHYLPLIKCLSLKSLK